MKKSVAEYWMQKLVSHLEADIMPFWTTPAMLGCPVGNFPTFATQTAVPFYGALNYARMQGRATYAYLAAFEITGKTKYRDVGFRGLEWLSRLKRRGGGYYSLTDCKGIPYNAPITVQDLSYIGLPLAMAYSLTREQKYLDDLWGLIDFIVGAKFFNDGRLIVDALTSDFTMPVYFEGVGTNIVSLLDFLNVLYLPALELTPQSMLAEERINVFKTLIGSLVSDFYSEGIFWNDSRNRKLIYTKHVDLGHTAKAYGILYRARKFLETDNKNYEWAIQRFSNLVKSSSDEDVGWRTDFEGVGVFSRRRGLQWWRHIVVDQVVSLYANSNGELDAYLFNGLEKWFSLDYIDKSRPCRGIRQYLDANGHCENDFDYSTCKANEWKSAYHEVDHVRSLIGYFSQFVK